MELTPEQMNELAVEQSNTVLRSLTDQIADMALKNAHLTGALNVAENQCRLLAQENERLEALVPKDKKEPEEAPKEDQPEQEAAKSQRVKK